MLNYDGNYDKRLRVCHQYCHGEHVGMLILVFISTTIKYSLRKAARVLVSLERLQELGGVTLWYYLSIKLFQYCSVLTEMSSISPL